MYITFYGNNKKWGGLGNQGGSRTIILSSQVLRELGHRVDIVANKDTFSWFEHPPIKHKVNPKTDVIIAVSISDISDVALYNRKRGIKMFYWARPWETWQMSEERCIKTLFKFHRLGGTIMVNAGWMHDWLKLHGIYAPLIYSGQDIECVDLKPDYDSEFNLVIGAQYSSKLRKGWKEFKKIAKILGTEKYEYVAFGSEKCKDKFLSTYLRNPERKKLNDLYSQMDVFVCSSELEGFYNPGVEASIRGCLLLCNDNPRNGTRDYANPITAEFYNSSTMDDYLDTKRQADYILKLFKNLNFNLVGNCQKIIREKIGTRTHNMKKMVEVLSE